MCPWREGGSVIRRESGRTLPERSAQATKPCLNTMEIQRRRYNTLTHHVPTQHTPRPTICRTTTTHMDLALKLRKTKAINKARGLCTKNHTARGFGMDVFECMIIVIMIRTFLSAASLVPLRRTFLKSRFAHILLVGLIMSSV